jgi:CRP/FNR family transcriptional regulator
MRYIATGSMRAYYIDEKSQEHTLQLGVENWWINDLYSYLSGKSSRMFLQANEATTLVQISKKNLELLYREVPALSDFFRLKIQSAYVALQERTIESMSLDAHTRYQTFIKEYRNIEQRFPQYVIASYLGITPEFLSFLRKKHASDLS